MMLPGASSATSVSTVLELSNIAKDGGRSGADSIGNGRTHLSDSLHLTIVQ